MIKKIIGYGLLGAVMLIVGIKANAADPVVTRTDLNNGIFKITAAFSENGSGSLGNVDGWVFMATVNHDDATACADNMDITVTDSDGVDILGGAMTDLTPSTDDTQQFIPTAKFSPTGAADIGISRYVAGSLTSTFTETSTANCEGDLHLYFAR